MLFKYKSKIITFLFFFTKLQKKKLLTVEKPKATPARMDKAGVLGAKAADLKFFFATYKYG